MTTTRRLAAILAADVAGYSAAMERDEEGTAAAVRALRREVIEPKLIEHHGRLIKTTGDGFLAEFASPIAALNCALAIQQRRNESGGLRLRIGLNLGDVIIEESGDVLGEGVNVAARLEGLAEPGGILISSKIYSEVEGKVQATFDDRGEQQVKNITRPVRVYAVRTSTAASAAPASSLDTNKPLPLPDKPSIAVLPFQNMSGDPEQEYFADGMVEDIITALSRFKSLFVIARNSSFTYKGKAVDIKQVGRELGVRYVLEGSVRKVGGRVRITGQLIDSSSGAQIWADRFDHEMTDVFALQDEVAQSVVSAVEPSLRTAEIARSRVPTHDLSAYDLYLRALTELGTFTKESIQTGEALLRRAIDVDPHYSDAWALLADALGRQQTYGWRAGSQAAAETRETALTAVRLDPENGFAAAVAAGALAILGGSIEQAVDLAHRAIVLHPNSALVRFYAGFALIVGGELEEAVHQLRTGERMNPFDPRILTTQNAIAHAFFFQRKFQEAIDLTDVVLSKMPNHLGAARIAAAALVHLGRLDDARDRIRKILSHYPEASISGLFTSFRHPWMRDLYFGALREAGLPE